MLDKAHCHVNTSHHSEEFKKSMKNRLNRIEGQIRGINRMIQEDVYCDDILNQMAAVQSVHLFLQGRDCWMLILKVVL